MAEFRLCAIANGIDKGEVLSVHVKEGDSVDNYDLVLLLEIEKAVLEVRIYEAGRVAKVHVKPGDILEVGHAILTFEPCDGGAAARAQMAGNARLDVG